MLVSPADLLRIATGFLCHGIESKSLVELAGLSREEERTPTLSPIRRSAPEHHDALHRRAGCLPNLTSPLGQRTRYAYDPLNQLTAITDPLAGQTQFTY